MQCTEITLNKIRCSRNIKSTNFSQKCYQHQCRFQHKKDVDDCSICLEPLYRNTILTPCKHKFHNDCLIKWKLIANSCPCCRQKIVSESEINVQSINQSVILNQAIATPLPEEISILQNIQNQSIWPYLYNYGISITKYICYLTYE